MNNHYSNPCVRCGTQRVVVKTWKTKMYDSVIVNTETACPNPKCQRQVNKDNRKEKDRNDAIRLKTAQRIMNRKNHKKNSS